MHRLEYSTIDDQVDLTPTLPTPIGIDTDQKQNSNNLTAMPYIHAQSGVPGCVCKQYSLFNRC